jgi:hypothetical protein
MALTGRGECNYSTTAYFLHGRNVRFKLDHLNFHNLNSNDEIYPAILPICPAGYESGERKRRRRGAVSGDE